jgi:hypothetical protein
MEVTKIEAPMIYRAIGAIMSEIGPVGKDGFNQAQKFKFRSIEAVANAAHGLLAKHGVFCAPVCTDKQVGDRALGTGKTVMHAVLTMQYTFYAADGSSIVVTTLGEGMDSGDKAVNKAMSAAFKYALLQLFCIPTEEDGDYDDPTVDTYRQPAQAPNPAATSADKLAAIKKVTGWCQSQGINDSGHAATLIKAATQHALGKDKIETKEELDRVVSAILNNKYAPDSGEPVAA